MTTPTFIHYLSAFHQRHSHNYLLFGTRRVEVSIPYLLFLLPPLSLDVSTSYGIIRILSISFFFLPSYHLPVSVLSIQTPSGVTSDVFPVIQQYFILRLTFDTGHCFDEIHSLLTNELFHS